MAVVEVFHTKAGTAYLKAPGVVLHNRTTYEGDTLLMRCALTDHNNDWNSYTEETYDNELEMVIKHAGQACYQSYGPHRTRNEHTNTYIKSIIAQGHGSVLEHVTVGFFVYGISRACSHEIVRHRVGTAYSQVSQRYVDSTNLRFVMREEFVGNEAYFENYIDSVKHEYEAWQELMRTENSWRLNSTQTTELRKRAQQAARDVLPNCTETQMVLTANARTWRHFLTMRGSEQADTAIRALALALYGELAVLMPNVFFDFTVKISDIDGKPYLASEYGSV